MDSNRKIAIVIPVYGMEQGEVFLERSLKALSQQVFKDFVVVISDNCPDLRFDKIARKYKNLDVRISFCEKKGIAANTNNGITLAKKLKPEMIKFLYQDDSLDDPEYLGKVYVNFSTDWLVTASSDNKVPVYTGDIHLGNNKIGSPSAVTVKTKSVLYFDEKLTWLLDCDYYKRLYEKYGDPVIVKDTQVTIGTGEHQMTHILSDKIKLKEVDYMRHKYV